MEGVGLASPTQGITNKRINSLSPPPALRSTLQLLAALSARVMEVPRLARSTGFPSTESGLEGTPALCTRAPPHGAPSLRHTGRETRPRDAAAPHTSPPGSLVCIGVGQHVVVNAAVALAALPVPWHRRVGATPGSIPNITVGRAERASEPGTEGERERESERESERATTCDLSASQHTQMMPCARVHADTTR